MVTSSSPTPLLVLGNLGAGLRLCCSCPSYLCSSLAFSLVSGGWFRSHFVAGFILNVLLLFKGKL